MRAHVFIRVLARASFLCEHVLATRASTCFLHVRARYLFVRARLLFKNVRPGQLKKPASEPTLLKASFWRLILSLFHAVFMSLYAFF